MSSSILKRSLSSENSTVIPVKRRRCETDFLNIPAAQNTAQQSSIFTEGQAAPYKMKHNILNQIKSLQKHKQLSPASLPEADSLNLTGMDCYSGKTLFTFDQVLLMCKQKLLEREKELRERYDEYLQLKLAEQYDDFVKFTHDQIQRNLGVKPTYLS